MKYLNTKTQAVIETTCEIKGGNWVKVAEQPKTTDTETTTVKKATVAKKKTSSVANKNVRKKSGA